MGNAAKMMIYDCEIQKAILNKNANPIPDIEYCQGWDDFQGMGVSIIGAYDYEEDRYRVFMGDNIAEFNEMVNTYDVIVGFNSINFDNKLCAANGLAYSDEKSYDVLVELWRGLGLNTTFDYKTHSGLSLDACCVANFGYGKTNSGANAPIMWQRRQYGSLIDYCLDDIRWTRRLMDRILIDGFVINPKAKNSIIRVRQPF
jgi:hypothetical protein